LIVDDERQQQPPKARRLNYWHAGGPAPATVAQMIGPIVIGAIMGGLFGLFILMFVVGIWKGTGGSALVLIAAGAIAVVAGILCVTMCIARLRRELMLAPELRSGERFFTVGLWLGGGLGALLACAVLWLGILFG
jgi:hypothetical protein